MPPKKKWKVVDGAREADAMDLATCFEWLRTRGFDVNSWKNTGGLDPLHVAAKEGDEVMIGVLVDDAAVQVNNKCDKFQETPVLHAVRGGHVGAVRRLVGYGADMQGMCLLHEAATRGYRDIASVLLDGGVDVNEVDKEGNTAAYLCCTAGGRTETQAEILTLILDNGGDASEVFKGLSLLHTAAKSGFAACCKVLVKRGIDANLLVKSGSGGTALHRAAANGRVEALRELCSLGATVDVTNFAGRTPLASAVLTGEHDTLSALLELGASIEAKDTLGFTPLQYASACGNMKCAYLLIERGADVRALSSGGHSVLAVCLHPILHAKIGPMSRGSKDDRAKVARLLIEAGAEVDRAVLQLAVAGGMSDVILEVLNQSRRMSNPANGADLVVAAVEHGQDVVHVKLVNQTTGEAVGRTYKLNTRVVQQLFTRNGPKAGGGDGDEDDDERRQGGGGGGGGGGGEGAGIVPRLLDPAKYGFKEGSGGGGGGGAGDSEGSDGDAGKQITLQYSGTEFTEEGFAVVVEYLTTGRVDRSLVNTKRKRANNDSDDEAADTGDDNGGSKSSSSSSSSGDDGSSSGANSGGSDRCLFDGEVAARALHAARYFCLDGMTNEVKRLMGIYGFE